MSQPPSTPTNSHSYRPLLVPPAPRARPARGAGDSHVRLRTPVVSLPRAADIEHLDAQDLLDELCEDQLTMSVNLARLEESVAAAPRDTACRAVLRTIGARIADLGALRDALATVHLVTVDPRVQRLVTTGSALADYLRGIYAWAHAAIRALDHLASSLRARPDWALLRWRLEEAKNFHFDELHEPVRADLLALSIVANGGSFGTSRPPVEETRYAVEHLFVTAAALEEHLEERFG